MSEKEEKKKGKTVWEDMGDLWDTATGKKKPSEAKSDSSKTVKPKEKAMKKTPKKKSKKKVKVKEKETGGMFGGDIDRLWDRGLESTRPKPEPEEEESEEEGEEEETEEEE